MNNQWLRLAAGAVTTITCLTMVDAFCRAAETQTHPAPFVVGFERFARHGDIDPLTGGRLLVSELSCTACHKSPDAALKPKLGPRLNGASDRLRTSWIREYLASPQTIKPGTTMPDVLSTYEADKKRDAIEALAAFLATQHEPFAEVRASGANPVPHQFWLKGNVTTGRKLYHQIGCVACHEPDPEYEGGNAKSSGLDKLLAQLDPEEIEEMGLTAAMRPVPSAPHPELQAKYTRRSLTMFLLNPESVRPSGRMPSLKLAPIEAAHLTAYLLKDQPADITAPADASPEDRVAKGKRLFEQLGCTNCHSANGVKPTRFAKPFDKLDVEAKHTCFGVVRDGQPRFHVDKLQTRAIRASLKNEIAPTTKQTENPQASVELGMLRLNCYGCHQRDQHGGVGRKRQPYFEITGHVDLGDEGRLPPPLTGVGAKLRKAWLRRVLDGKGDIRPYMHARMPKFPRAQITELEENLLRADEGQKPTPVQEVFGNRAGLAEAGRALLDVGCVQCHVVRGEQAPGVVGVEISKLAERLNPQWFHDFLLNPGQLKSRTRMPTFFPQGRSPNTRVLGGDVERQIAAIWTYLDEADKHPLPEKIARARSQSFELTPTDRPILLRTFMKQAGTHAIAVGFPQKVHYAFDAESVRLAELWRGRFLDAYGTWFIRFAPNTDPLADTSLIMPAGPTLALLENSAQAWPTDSTGYQFQGYRLDKKGTPTFLYRYEQFKVTDRIEPDANQTLRRRLTIKPGSRYEAPSARLSFRINAGKRVERPSQKEFQNDAGLTVTVTDADSTRAAPREGLQHKEWLLEIPKEFEATKSWTIEVLYHWD